MRITETISGTLRTLTFDRMALVCDTVHSSVRVRVIVGHPRFLPRQPRAQRIADIDPPENSMQLMPDVTAAKSKMQQCAAQLESGERNSPTRRSVSA